MSTDYLLGGGSAEVERLRLTARVWEPEAEVMLDKIGLTPGANCIDLGCGPAGILGPLSRRVGAEGKVLGVDTNSTQLTAAREFVTQNALHNVEIRELDAYHTSLLRESFDLTHVRFLFSPVGRDDELLREMLGLTKLGGTVAIQETEATSWNCFPQHPAWFKLKELILAAFKRGGGDFDAGQRTFTMLRKAGLQDVQVRAALFALPHGHPYRQLPVQFATSLRPRILSNSLLSEAELDELLGSCQELINDPARFWLTFTVIQVWGRK